MESTTKTPITLGISSCLLGEQVRYDGNHKRDNYIIGTLGRFFNFRPFCPEVAIGLGVPRPTIRLSGNPSAPRAVGVIDPERDVTDALREYGESVAAGLDDISGYLLKSKSPSCGMERVKVYGSSGPQGSASGIFAAALRERLPLLPMEEEGRLSDPALRENFIERVFAYHRWQELVAKGVTPAGLIDFHSRHKLSLMAHSPEAYRELGQLVATAGKGDLQAIAEQYITDFMGALGRLADRGRNANVLQHLAGYLKQVLDSEDRKELAEVIERYRTGMVPLVVPITLLRHHFRRHPDPYVQRQWYLEPHPAELMLRNGI